MKKLLLMIFITTVLTGCVAPPEKTPIKQIKKEELTELNQNQIFTKNGNLYKTTKE